MEYTVNFLADIDVTIKADSPAEAKEKAAKLLNEYYEARFEYAYLSEVKFILDENGKEI